jgi:hypothetical protein
MEKTKNKRVNLKGEKWLPTVEDPRYEVSNKGRIWSTVSHRFLKQSLRNPERKNNRYNRVSFGGKTYQVHRLEVMAFRGPPPDEFHTMVHHKDHVTTNNKLENLEWITPSGNARMAVAYYKKLRETIMNEVHCVSLGLKVKSIRGMEKLLRKIGYPTVSYGNIYDCLKGKRKKHLGLQFTWA